MTRTKPMEKQDAIRLTKRNQKQYESYFDPDALQNIERAYFRGLVIPDETGNPEAAMIWEYREVDDEDDPISEIVWLRSEKESATERLLTGYETEMEKREVSRSYFELPLLSEKEEAVFRNAGYVLENRESRDIVTTVGELSARSFLMGLGTPSVVSLKDITEDQFHGGVTNCLFYEKKGLLEDLAFLTMDWFDAEVSSCYLRKDKVKGFLLAHRKPSGILMIDLLFASGTNAALNIYRLIRHTIRAAEKCYPPETKILIRRHNPRASRLAKLLLPGKHGELVTYGRKE